MNIDEIIKMIKKNFEGVEIDIDNPLFPDIPDDIRKVLISFHGQIQNPLRLRVKFRTGYGASIIRDHLSLGEGSQVEIAVIQYDEQGEYYLVWDLPMDGVTGSLDEIDIVPFLKDIEHSAELLLEN